MDKKAEKVETVVNAEVKPPKRRGRPPGAKNKKTITERVERGVTPIVAAPEVVVAVQESPHEPDVPEEFDLLGDSPPPSAEGPNETFLPEVDLPDNSVSFTDPEGSFDAPEVPDLKALALEARAKRAEQKPATSPWNSTESPWQEDIFRLPKKRSGYKVRWTDPTKIEKRLYQGWCYAKASNYGIIRTEDKENTSITSHVTRRGLILMEISNELNEQRDAFYKGRTDNLAAGANQAAKKEAKAIDRDFGKNTNLKEVDKPE